MFQTASMQAISLSVQGMERYVKEVTTASKAVFKYVSRGAFIRARLTTRR